MFRNLDSTKIDHRLKIRSGLLFQFEQNLFGDSTAGMEGLHAFREEW